MENTSGSWKDCLRYSAQTDVGLRRANNQDSMNVMLAGSYQQFLEQGHVFVVADGMGAHAAGELASKMAADIIPLAYFKVHDKSPPEALHDAIQDAHSQIHGKGESDDAFRGMGTTVDTMVMLPQGVLIGHVGDSRVYRFRGERIEQLTFDHSLVWELRASGDFPNGELPSHIPKNIITRSLGPHPEVRIDIEGPFPVEPGDMYLLCSDGLSGMIEDDEIGQILATHSPEDAASVLIDLSNLRGGPDNITVVVVRADAPLVDGTAGRRTGSGNRSQDNRLATAMWWLFGVCGVLAVVMAISQFMPGAIGAAGLAVLFLLLGLVNQFAGTSGGMIAPIAPSGKGPYATASAVPESPFIDRLAKTADELRQAAENDDWDITWSGFQRLEIEAQDAVKGQKFATAARKYCSAIRFMMSELKRQK